MPIEITYLIILLAVIVIVFVLYKRPIYEAMFMGFLALIAVTGKWDMFFPMLIKPSTDTLFYAIFAFLMLAFIFTETDVANDINNIITALVGRFSGGAGYVSLISSTFMAALSGTGPGNVAADGIFTIPAMIRTGYPKAIAASVEMATSSLGPMVPPSGTILLSFGVLNTIFPDKFRLSDFWIVVWIVALYFIIQRFLTLLALIKIYKVKPIPKSEIPNMRESLKKGWKALMIPVIIFVPLLLDSILGETFLSSRLGEAGASAFSSSVILFTPGLAAFYAYLISRKNLKNRKDYTGIVNLVKKGIKTVIPVSATIYFAYCISNLFGALEIGAGIEKLIASLGFSRIGIALFIPFVGAILGMMLPGSAQVTIVGSALIGAMVGVGVNPLVAAAILPALTSALEGMTPPLALSMYAAMGIAKSSFKETAKFALVWVFTHIIVLFLLILGVLPVFS